jgi:hypothetical protein
METRLPERGTGHKDRGVRAGHGLIDDDPMIEGIENS